MRHTEFPILNLRSCVACVVLVWLAAEMTIAGIRIAWAWLDRMRKGSR